ncbi:hypothetical protein N6B72_10445 [Chryseobacterium soli]|uniref:hypothetical protein n=1 Tax=Chryseobacterium soli TaxID=445961 RepID=UPI0029534482|nr:hypothetical protein [Chryseobacterium soli]MDV7697339.1 hypothetical protein [Chryseobacterium soli]
MNKEVIETFTDLATGKLTATEWIQWFEEYKNLVEITCGRTAFLKIKPKGNLTCIGNAYAGQTAVFNWLTTQNINTEVSNIYQKAYEKEFNEFIKQEKQKDKLRQQYVKDNFAYLADFYPRFFKQLQKCFDTTNTIEIGKTLSEISEKELLLNITFSPEMITFFSAISKLSLEGIDIDFDTLSIEFFEGKSFLVLGEFWYYGDGDLLLYDLTNYQLFSYAHEYQPPKLIQLANIPDLLEKTFTKYLKSQAE